MNMFIKTPFEKYDREVKNPNFIPSIGDRVNVGYSPPPKVVEVIHDYHQMIVVVVVE